MPAKALLREEIKTRLKKTPREEFDAQGKAAAALLRSSPVWSGYAAVFLFLSTNNEISTRPLLEAALRDGKAVFAPRVEAETLAFYSLASPEGPWRNGPFGIREPLDGTPAAPGDFPALFVVPGLAFDRNGNRLGKGGGYYDRFFARLDAAGGQYRAAGFCMDFQVVEHVPADARDKKVDYIVTKNEAMARNTE